MGTIVEGLNPSLLDPSRDSHIFCNDEADYESACQQLPRCNDFGLYKQDPCQPKLWHEIPIMESTVQFVNDQGKVWWTTRDDINKATDEEKQAGNESTACDS